MSGFFFIEIDSRFGDCNQQMDRTLQPPTKASDSGSMAQSRTRDFQKKKKKKKLKKTHFIHSAITLL